MSETQQPNSKQTADQTPKARPVVTLALAAFLAAVLVSALSACGPSNQFHPVASSNKTGFTDPAGRVHTGAGDDQALAQLKTELAGDRANDGIDSLEKEDRELAAQILGAKIEEEAKSIRVHVRLRDQGTISFDFTEKDIAKPATAQNADVRYKSIVGKVPGGKPAQYEMALLCRHIATPKEGERRCATAMMSLKEQRGSKAKAGFILRYQEVTVLVRSPKTTPLRNDTLKRLVSEFHQARIGTLQSFEVAWGPSGFDLNMQDSELCPSGRLVETNDLDEPLRLGCGNPDTTRGLEGRMIGNTTRGELFLEITATTPGLLGGLSPESVERAFILVRQKKAPKPVAPAKPGDPASPSPDSTDDEEDDLFLEEEQQPLVPSPQQPGGANTPSELKGWLVPVDPNDPVTKQWAKDRKRPLVAKKVDEWKASSRLKGFATHFLPNRDLVHRSLQESRVPGEFALITLIESHFFIKPGYPVEVSSASALGPWQFMPRTAADSRFGLKVLPLVPIKNDKGKVIRNEANPCDERADLAKSSVAAGKYFRVLLNMFPRDPRLALAAYNWGEGNVECIGSTSAKCNRLNQKRGFSQARLGEIRELGLSFWAIHRFNMAPSETLNYVINFVAAHHAALEMDAITLDKNIAPWKPAAQCGR